MSAIKHRLLVRFAAGLIASALLATTALHATTAAAEDHHHGHAAVREVEIVVEGSYKPARVPVHEGERVRLKFVRKESNSCTREVIFPKLGIKRELPPNKPVMIVLPVLAPGEYEFKCGMNMIKGSIVVAPRTQH